MTFFKGKGYEERFVNGFWLVKQWNGNTEKWQVAIYTQDSFDRYKTYDENRKQMEFEVDNE